MDMDACMYIGAAGDGIGVLSGQAGCQCASPVPCPRVVCMLYICLLKLYA
jgi:hypothetical protein